MASSSGFQSRPSLLFSKFLDGFFSFPDRYRFNGCGRKGIHFPLADFFSVHNIQGCNDRGVGNSNSWLLLPVGKSDHALEDISCHFFHTGYIGQKLQFSGLFRNPHSTSIAGSGFWSITKMPFSFLCFRNGAVAKLRCKRFTIL